MSRRSVATGVIAAGVLVLVAAAATGCKKNASSKFPPGEAGAKALLGEFLKPGADHAKLTLELKPSSADYRKIFASDDHAKRAEAMYTSLWERVPRDPIAPKTGQTELLLWSASTDDLKNGTVAADKFPGGYRRAAASLKSGLTVYRFKFVRPGEALGMAFDGLYNIDGRWVLAPKPWRIVR